LVQASVPPPPRKKKIVLDTAQSLAKCLFSLP
jgi:hypothetical protein